MSSSWIGIDELKALSPWTDRTIQRKSQRCEIDSRWRAERGRNGKRVREYSVQSLPSDLQMKFAKAQALKFSPEPEDSAITVSEPTSLIKVNPQQMKSTAGRIALTPEQTKQAEYRLLMIQPMLDFGQHKSSGRAAVTLPGGRVAASLQEICKHISEQSGVSSPTLRRWYDRYRQRGFEALADDVRCDKGISRFFKNHPAVDQLVQAKYLSERLSIQLTYEAMCREFPALNLPCYDTVRVYLHSLPEPIKIMAREGSEQFQQRVEPFICRKPPERINQVWVSDHVAHDVWVRNVDLETGLPFFQGVPLNAALRPWMTVWLDWRPRKIVGAVWCATPNSHTISSALRIAILECGRPEEAYVDNGKDYRKLRAGAAHELHEAGDIRKLSPECMGVLARLNIKTTACLPYHGQSKPVESWFGNRLHPSFDKLWTASYCGTGPEDRPEQCDEALKAHQLFLEGKRATSPLPAASEFVHQAKGFIARYNSQMKHTGRGMNKRTPDQVVAELGKNICFLDDTDRAALGALFWDRQKRRVKEGGCVQLYSQRFEPADDLSRGALYEQIERDILVACDPTDLRQAIAMDLDGRPIGELKASVLVEWGNTSREAIQASLRERRRAVRGVNRYLSSLANGVDSELDVLRRTNPLPARAQAEAIIPVIRQLGATVGESRPLYAEDIAARHRARAAAQQGGN